LHKWEDRGAKDAEVERRRREDRGSDGAEVERRRRENRGAEGAEGGWVWGGGKDTEEEVAESVLPVMYHVQLTQLFLAS